MEMQIPVFDGDDHEIFGQELHRQNKRGRFSRKNSERPMRGMMMEEEESVVDYTKRLMEIYRTLPSKFDCMVNSMRFDNFTLTKVVWVLREWEFDADEHEKREASHNHNKKSRQ
ncbi:hypothetical protein Bca4012_083120 [Brassica carinata]